MKVSNYVIAMLEHDDQPAWHRFLFRRTPCRSCLRRITRRRPA